MVGVTGIEPVTHTMSTWCLHFPNHMLSIIGVFFDSNTFLEMGDNNYSSQTRSDASVI